MKKIHAFIAVLFALIIAATPAVAAPNDVRTVGYMDAFAMDTMIIAQEVELSSAAEAKIVSQEFDVVGLEDTFDFLIIGGERLSGTTLRGTGADTAWIYQAYDPDFGDGLVHVATKGKFLYVIQIFGPSTDGAEFATITRDMVMNGLPDDAPFGWLEVYDESDNLDTWAQPGSL